MAVKGLYFDADVVNGNPDRSYSSADFADYYRPMVGNGVFRNTDPDACKASIANPQSTTITVKTGRIWINGYQVIITADETLPLQYTTAKARVIVRLNNEWSVRAPQLLVVYNQNSESYPELVRNTVIYDLCLANIDIDTTEETAVATDTRDNIELCGTARFVGLPAWQPPSDVPSLVWDYTLFPETLTEEQKEMVESTPQFIDIVNNSSIKQISFPVAHYIATGNEDGEINIEGLDLAADGGSYHFSVMHPIGMPMYDGEWNIAINGDWWGGDKTLKYRSVITNTFNNFYPNPLEPIVSSSDAPSISVIASNDEPLHGITGRIYKFNNAIHYDINSYLTTKGNFPAELMSNIRGIYYGDNISINMTSLKFAKSGDPTIPAGFEIKIFRG